MIYINISLIWISNLKSRLFNIKYNNFYLYINERKTCKNIFVVTRSDYLTDLFCIYIIIYIY